jgi:hypothetical protein
MVLEYMLVLRIHVSQVVTDVLALESIVSLLHVRGSMNQMSLAVTN